jgi:O-acetyl-ADP-ribose deacetylase (regulator of RNase III)
LSVAGKAQEEELRPSWTSSARAGSDGGGDASPFGGRANPKHYMKTIKEILLKKTVVRAIHGDLTKASVDAIVNAANSHLQHGGGVAGAIVRKGGDIIQEESDRIGFVPVGQCAVTSAGKLPAGHLIHTVGPRWGEGDEEAKLRSAVKNTLKTAEARKFSSIAMPAISAGIFGFPKELCARIIVEEIASFVSEASPLREIDIYLMDPEITEFFSAEINSLDRAS